MLLSFLGLNSQKSEKSKNYHSRHSHARKTPHDSTRHHGHRHRERSDRPRSVSERGSLDIDDDDERDPYPKNRQGHSGVKSRSRYERDADLDRLYHENNRERERREHFRNGGHKRDWRDADRESEHERGGRQSERRAVGEENRRPSLSRALHRQPGETGQDMRDRMDGHYRRGTQYDSEQVPTRRHRRRQEDEGPERPSMPRRPAYTTTTTYQYPGGPNEDPAPGSLRKSATWPSETSSQKPKPRNGHSHLHYSDSGDSENPASCGESSRDQAPPSPIMRESTAVEPPRQRHTGYTTSAAYRSGLAGKSWAQTQQSLFSGSRMVRLPPPRPVAMLSQKDWESEDLDQDLAREVAFEDLGVTTEQEERLPYNQQDELTRCYFPTLEDLDLRLKAPKARSLSEFANIFVGMKEGYLRVSTHARQTDMLTNPHSEPFQPANRPPYVAFANRLDDDFEKAGETMGTRSAAGASESTAGTEGLEKLESRATRGVREQYGWFGSDTVEEPTRRTYKYPDAGQ